MVVVVVEDGYVLAKGFMSLRDMLDFMKRVTLRKVAFELD